MCCEHAMKAAVLSAHQAQGNILLELGTTRISILLWDHVVFWQKSWIVGITEILYFPFKNTLKSLKLCELVPTMRIKTSKPCKHSTRLITQKSLKKKSQTTPITLLCLISKMSFALLYLKGLCQNIWGLIDAKSTGNHNWKWKDFLLSCH